MLAARLTRLPPVPTLAWAVALLVAGAWMATRVPLEWVPSVELPVVRIAASWPGSSPRAVERYVTAPIERAVQGVAGTAHVESLSEEGRASVTLEVAEGAALGPYVARVNEQLALLRETLPEGVVPRLSKQVPEALRDQQGFMTLQLVGPQTPSALRRLAEEAVAPRLRTLPGVADLVVRGGTTRELLVTLDPERLAAYGLTPTDVRGPLRTATTTAVYGALGTQGRRTLLLTPAEDDVDALRRLVVRPPATPGTTPGTMSGTTAGGGAAGGGAAGRRARTAAAGDGAGGGAAGRRAEARAGGIATSRPVRLADVATVTLGPAPPRSITRIDGDPVVTLTLDRTPASAMLDVAAAVRARLDALAPTLPEGTRLLVADDRSTDVRAQLRDLTWRGGLGLVLVVLVLLAMLKSLRAVGVVLFTVAVAQAVALALMGPLGLTLNLLTLAGLALVFGLLVDNSVVVTEQLVLQRARRGEGEGGAAAARALGAVGLPLLGGTLTTMAVMGPLVYLSGELRALFVPFGVLVALTLGASLLSAAALVPACARFLPPPHAAPHARAPRWLRQAVQAPYAFAARAPRLTLAALVLLLGTPLWLLPETLDAEPPADPTAPLPLAQKRLADLYDATVGSETGQAVRAWLDPALGGLVRPFVRETTFGSPYDFSAEPAVRVYLGFPPGTPIGRADTLLARFEQTALASPATRRTLARISERQATLRVLFTDAALGTAEPYLVRERLIREAVLLAGLDVSVGGLVPQGYYSGLGGNISGLAVQAFGPNYDDLEALCERFAARMQRASRRVVGVDIDAGRYGRQTPRTVLRFRIDADAQARTGVAPARLAARLRPVLTTRFPAFYADLDGVPRLPVRIVVAGADDLDVTALADRPLPLGDSLQVKLKTLARYRVAQVPSRIERRDQQYRRYLRIDFRGPPTMGSDLLDRVLDEMPLPAGYRLARDRGFFTAATARSFGGLLAGTVVLVFLVTAIVFESWRLPLVVLLSVPTAAVGVAIGFLWTEAAFAEGAFIGTVLLVGIAANDSILLTDRYRSLRRAHPHADAGRLARLAVRARLRPMWTTTLSSVVAMLPLLVFPHEGGGGAFWTGLAVTVTGGLLASTLLAPPATVALLSLSGRRRSM